MEPWLLTLDLSRCLGLELCSFRALLFCLVFDCGMGCMSLSLLVKVWVLLKLQSIVFFYKVDCPLFLPFLQLFLFHFSFSRLASEFALAVFLDLSKAFDSIDRQILCQKLNYYDIQGNCLKWFESYLGCRRQVVRFGDVLSDELSCGYGVPQGGAISAVLFIIYINDLVKCTNEVEFAIYADDTNLFTTGNCMKQNIEKI